MKKLKLVVFIFYLSFLQAVLKKISLSKLLMLRISFLPTAVFVTGGNIYEIKKDSTGKMVSRPLFEESCYATGIVESGRFLYATCTKVKRPRFKDLIKQKDVG